MSNLTLSVLGELQVSIDNAPISLFESDKVRALLAYLAVEASRSHRRETLSGLLWPDCSEESARHNLRQALFNLRLALGDHTATPPFLLITHDAIQFNQESNFSLDLAQFNAYFETWEKSRRQEEGVSTVPISHLEAMAQLYRGEFLQQFFLNDSADFEEWKLVQRETLHQHAMDALNYLTDHYEQQGDYQNARRLANRQLELDPWREEAHCQLMRVLALDGQRSAALAQYETCRRVLSEELGVEPSQKTRDLNEQIRSGTLVPKAESPPQAHITPLYNLPVSLTPFVGREPELADLGRLIANPECRCITLVGPGGIGKTRLALRTAEQHQNDFVQGSAFIPLASVGNVDAIIQAMANAIHFAFYGPKDPRLQLLNYLRDKQMLLIVDNVEHLLVEGTYPGTVAEVLIDILQQAPQVKLLVTSREAMNIQGEWLFEVQGLAFPKEESTDGWDEYGAVTLFAQRAGRARPGFEMTNEDKTGVVRLCRLVEGMPLAIELAAAWVRILSPSEIATEVENSLDFLNAQMRDLPERHRSMRAVFDHSCQTLSVDERKVLSRLSVFRGGFRRQAAEKVAGASLSDLSSLVIRSLLRRTSTGRYDLHELIRQYTASKLAEDPKALHTVQEQHSLYYLGLLEENDARLKSKYQIQALAELTDEMDNLRAAWNWSAIHHEIIALSRVSATFWYLFELHSWWKEGEVTFRNAAEELRMYIQDVEPGEPIYLIALNRMLAHSAYFSFRLGKSKEAYAILSPSTDFLRTSADPSSAIYSPCYLGIVCWEQGKFSEAKESLQQSLELARKYGEHWTEAAANEFIGIIAHEQGEYHQAQEYLREALAIGRKLGDPMLIAHVLSYLGRTMRMLGEYSEAEKLLRESVVLAREIDYRSGIGLALDALGLLTYAQGRLEEARTIFLESGSLFREVGDTYRQSRVLNHQGVNFLALNDIAEAQIAFKAALRMAHEGGYIPTAIEALSGLATIEARHKANEGTLEMVIFILQHSVSTQESKDLTTRLRAELEAKLSQDEIEAARESASAKSLNELVHQVLGSS